METLICVEREGGCIYNFKDDNKNRLNAILAQRFWTNNGLNWVLFENDVNKSIYRVDIYYRICFVMPRTFQIFPSLDKAWRRTMISTIAVDIYQTGWNLEFQQESLNNSRKLQIPSIGFIVKFTNVSWEW